MCLSSAAAPASDSQLSQVILLLILTYYNSLDSRCPRSERGNPTDARENLEGSAVGSALKLHVGCWSLIG